jgi:DNA ligase D-like protein (predicted polymerase)
VSRDVPVTNPDRVLFPEIGLTKGEVVEYFAAVGDGILAAVRERPCMLQRRVGDETFFQRRVPNGAPEWVQSAEGMLCPTEPAVIAWAANLGTLTFHPWAARRGTGGRPDRMVIDLDPQPGTEWAGLARVALAVRDLLVERGLTGFPKTSGGRGVHVCVPIEPRGTYEEAHGELVAIGRELARRMPDEVTVERLKRDRGARIYVDSVMTTASAYSIRPTPRATVSAPVTWDELPEVRPEDFDVRTMPARFAAVGDLHAEV